MKLNNTEKLKIINAWFDIGEFWYSLREGKNSEYSKKDAFRDIVEISKKYNLSDSLMIVGGFAMCLNKNERNTKDIDYLVDASKLDIIK